MGRKLKVKTGKKPDFHLSSYWKNQTKNKKMTMTVIILIISHQINTMPDIRKIKLCRLHQMLPQPAMKQG